MQALTGFFQRIGILFLQSLEKLTADLAIIIVPAAGNTFFFAIRFFNEGFLVIVTTPMGPVDDLGGEQQAAIKQYKQQLDIARRSDLDQFATDLETEQLKAI